MAKHTTGKAMLIGTDSAEASIEFIDALKNIDLKKGKAVISISFPHDDSMGSALDVLNAHDELMEFVKTISPLMRTYRSDGTNKRGTLGYKWGIMHKELIDKYGG